MAAVHPQQGTGHLQVLAPQACWLRKCVDILLGGWLLCLVAVRAEEHMNCMLDDHRFVQIILIGLIIGSMFARLEVR